MSKRTAERKIVEQEFLPHLDSLHRYGLFLTRDTTMAEELTQETMLKAIRASFQYKEGTNSKAWLFRIMTNTFLNQTRRRKKIYELDEGTMNVEEEAEVGQVFVHSNQTPEQSFVTMLSKSKVREAIEKLPPEFRSVVVLADLEELSYKEIAEVLSCPIGTVMSRLHRGRKLLRTRLMSWALEMGLVKGVEEEDEPKETISLEDYRRSTGPTTDQ